MEFIERQLTFTDNGHTIHHMQVFSPDDQWIAYDRRNDDTKIASTGSIEMVNTNTKEIVVLYKVSGQTDDGPGVGAVTFSPTANRVLFIHGIRNSNKLKPYGFTRRTGVAVDINRPNQPLFMDARNVLWPFTAGALRGGTHAHSWSGDGEWISFTYNDYIMEQLAKNDATFSDLRTVGVMVRGKVDVPEDRDMENNSGHCFATVVARVTDKPRIGSDEINKAFDEGWIGHQGYQGADGVWQRKAIAFQGNVLNEAGKQITEIFVLDLPENISVPADKNDPLQGTAEKRPGVPKGVRQRRLTYTEKGVIGPRHWLRSTRKGDLIAFLSADAQGIIQVFGISPNGGVIKQLTNNPFSITGPFNFSPDDMYIAYPAENSIFITNWTKGETFCITPRFSEKEKPVGAPVWSNSGAQIAYNRYVQQKSRSFLQIFLLEINSL
jgi:hypothetical protein